MQPDRKLISIETLGRLVVWTGWLFAAPSIYLALVLLCLSLPLRAIIGRQEVLSFPSVRPSVFSFSGTHVVSSLPPQTTSTVATASRMRTAVKCEGRSDGTRKRTSQTWTLPPPPAVMTKMLPSMEADGRWALAASGSWVRLRRGSAGTAPGRGSPSGGVACKPVPPSAPACRCESRSDGHSTNCRSSLRSEGRDLRPDLRHETRRISGQQRRKTKHCHYI